MEKKQKIVVKSVLALSAIVLIIVLVPFLRKSHEIQSVPSSVSWANDVTEQVDLIRQSETEDVAIKNLEKNGFPFKVLNKIPEKAKEMNLPWAETSSIETLYLFSSEGNVYLQNEQTKKKFNVRSLNFEPGFMVMHNKEYHYYLLQSFTKVLNGDDMSVTFSENYIKMQKEKERMEKEKDAIKVVRSIQFSDKFYPCSIYDNIDYWVKFAKNEDIDLLGRFNGTDFQWEKIPYNEAQYYLDMGYVLILDLPEGSVYIKLKSGEEYIQTQGKKMAIELS